MSGRACSSNVTPLITVDATAGAGQDSPVIAIDCGLAGTVMRFLPPLAGLVSGRVPFDGDQAARKRPMLTTIESLRELGLRVEASGDSLPFTVHGTGEILGGEFEPSMRVRAVNLCRGLLLSAARFERGLG
jgi:3-phosphoshikimate 1-carboxyvinyltransferase